MEWVTRRCRLVLEGAANRLVVRIVLSNQQTSSAIGIAVIFLVLASLLWSTGLTPLQYDGLVVAIIVGALAIISYAVGLFRWIWERLSGRQSHELREHYSRMRDEVFEPLSKLPSKLPMNLRNASEVKVNLPTAMSSYSNAVLHLEQEVPRASNILASLKQWESLVQSVALEIDKLAYELSAVKPDDTTGWLRIRFILDAVWNIYLSSQDSSALKTMLSALRIEGKTLYLGDNALDQGYELMVSLEVIKKCMNDDRFANILADLGDRRHELESDMNIVSAACASISEVIKESNYSVKKRCCPTSRLCSSNRIFTRQKTNPATEDLTLPYRR